MVLLIYCKDVLKLSVKGTNSCLYILCVLLSYNSASFITLRFNKHVLLSHYKARLPDKKCIVFITLDIYRIVVGQY